MRQESSLIRALTGKRITGQRRLILRLIQETRGHVDADELYRRSREIEPRLSLSTVYRTLRLLKEAGLVEERHFDDEHHHYEVKVGQEHSHLFCLSCGQVVEFESPLTQELEQEIGSRYGFQVTHGEFHLGGYCQKCRAQAAEIPLGQSPALS
ncbi:MAG: transcriptional repressor [Chloroflexi bacterium]|nr:transcriptional repressor [Chloroflexota bacterium]